MMTSLYLKSHTIFRLLVVMLAISCLTFLSACSSKEVTDESTIGSNNAAQTNPNKIERNSMDDVDNAGTDSEGSGEQNTDTTSTDK